MEDYKYYEVCLRIEPRPTKTFQKFLRRIFPVMETVECFVIRTKKTKEEILEYYGGSRFVDGITECAKELNIKRHTITI